MTNLSKDGTTLPEPPEVMAAYALADVLLEGYEGTPANVEAFARLSSRYPDVEWWDHILPEFVQQDARDEADRRLDLADKEARKRYQQRRNAEKRKKRARIKAWNSLVSDPLPAWKRDVEAALLNRPGTHRKRSDELSIRCIEPNHEDKHPSASWNTEKGTGTCHACHASWSTKQAAELIGINLRTPGAEVRA